jgi:threonine synthase
MFVCPEGAATVAALELMLAEGDVSHDDKVLLLNTGTGLKYLELV